MLAKSMITIDHLSGGRLEFGLGAGWHEPEFRAFHYDLRAGQAAHGPARGGDGRSCARSSTTRSPTITGQYFDFTNAYINPRPLGKLPLWIGGLGEQRTARMAAKYADGWNIPYVGPGAYTHKVQVLRDWCEKEGRDPAAVALATQGTN